MQQTFRVKQSSSSRLRASELPPIKHHIRQESCELPSDSNDDGVGHDDEIDRAMLEVETVSGKDSMNCAVISFFQVILRNRYSIVRNWHYRACRSFNC